MLAVGNDWTRARFDGPFYLSPLRAGRPTCSIVFVQSADGNTGAAVLPISAAAGPTNI